jgi:hypothetical protein
MENPGPLDQPGFVWLRDLLWPASVSATEGREYAVIVRDRRPRVVVPLESRRAMRTVMERTSADVGTAQKVARRLAAIGAGLGLLGPVLRTRFRSGRADDAAADASEGAGGIEAYLAASLGIPVVHVAASIGPPRPNAKPVLHLLAPDGTTVGFAKVGWNGLTRTLVKHEAEVLRILAERPVQRIEPPRLLHFGRWRDLEISILSPLEPTRRGDVERRDPTTAELLDLASLGDRSSTDLADSKYSASLFRRIAALEGPRREAYQEAFDRLTERAAGVTLEFGRLHGDWTPWNMVPLRGRLLVWDWERSAADQPMLMDAVHYVFQREWLRRSGSTGDAIDSAIAHAATHAPGFGLAPNTPEIIAGLYLLELALRYTENAAAGTDELRTERHLAIDAQLRAFA